MKPTTGVMDELDAPLEPSPEDIAAISGVNGNHPPKAAVPVKPPDLVARSIGLFTVAPDDDPDCLLGNRWVSRGDGVIMVSSSGMGKSSASIQMAVTWALGRSFMGVLPKRPLTSIIFQSEDGDGDIGEIWQSVCYKMQLTKDEIDQAASRVEIVTDRINRGPIFIEQIKRHLAEKPRDLVWINPLAAFMKGDGTTAEVAGDFLREGLNRLNHPPTFAYFIVHHTTKPPTGRDKGERKWHEVMYDMAGSYDLIGWARAIISLRPTDVIGEFNLVFAKRGKRAGVTRRIPQGTGYRLESVVSVPIKHSHEMMAVAGIKREVPVIFWEPREEGTSQSQPPEIKPEGRPKQHKFETYEPAFPKERKDAKGLNDLFRSALLIKLISKGTFHTLVADAQITGRIICEADNPARPVYYLAQQLKPKEMPEDESFFETGQ